MVVMKRVVGRVNSRNQKYRRQVVGRTAGRHSSTGSGTGGAGRLSRQEGSLPKPPPDPTFHLPASGRILPSTPPLLQ